MFQPAKHTPKPWTALISEKGYFPSVDIGKRKRGDDMNIQGRITVNGATPTTQMETHNANAHLIAASPDLRECVEDLLSRYAHEIENDEPINAADFLDTWLELRPSFLAAYAKSNGVEDAIQD